MDKDEALKMALDALEDASCMVYSEFSIENEYEYEINACKKALAQPKEPQYINVYGYLENQNISFEKTIGMPCIGKIKLEVDETKDEAMQQAIDFLDGSYEAHAVRKALQEALAQDSVVLTDQLGMSRNQATIGSATPAQEPVAWMDKSRYFLELDLEDLCVMASCKKHEAVPLFTHPAPAHPASWRRLSKKKLEKIYGDSSKIDWYAYEAIDQALQKLNPF